MGGIYDTLEPGVGGIYDTLEPSARFECIIMLLGDYSYAVDATGLFEYINTRACI